jgi:hypothetical protein
VPQYQLEAKVFADMISWSEESEDSNDVANEPFDQRAFAISIRATEVIFQRLQTLRKLSKDTTTQTVRKRATR